MEYHIIKGYNRHHKYTINQQMPDQISHYLLSHHRLYCSCFILFPSVHTSLIMFHFISLSPHFINLFKKYCILCPSLLGLFLGILGSILVYPLFLENQLIFYHEIVYRCDWYHCDSCYTKNKNSPHCSLCWEPFWGYFWAHFGQKYCNVFKK